MFRRLLFVCVSAVSLMVAVDCAHAQEATFQEPVAYNRLGTIVRVPRPEGACLASQTKGTDALIADLKAENREEGYGRFILDLIADCNELKRVAHGEKKRPDSFILVTFPKDSFTKSTVKVETLHSLYFPLVTEFIKKLAVVDEAGTRKNLFTLLDSGKLNDGFFVSAVQEQDPPLFFKSFHTLVHSRTINFQLFQSGNRDGLDDRFAAFADAVRVANDRKSEIYSIRFVAPSALPAETGVSPDDNDAGGERERDDEASPATGVETTALPEAETETAKVVSSYDIPQLINSPKEQDGSVPQTGEGGTVLLLNNAGSGEVETQELAGAKQMDPAAEPADKDGFVSRIIHGKRVSFPVPVGMCATTEIEGLDSSASWMRMIRQGTDSITDIMANCDELRQIAAGERSEPSLAYAILETDLKMDSSVSLDQFVDMTYMLYSHIEKTRKEMVQKGMIPNDSPVSVEKMEKAKDGLWILVSETDNGKTYLIRSFITQAGRYGVGVSVFAPADHRQILNQSFGTIVDAFRVANGRPALGDLGESVTDKLTSPVFLAGFAGIFSFLIGVPMAFLMSRKKKGSESGQARVI